MKTKFNLLVAVLSTSLLTLGFGTPALADNSSVLGVEVSPNEAVVTLSDQAEIGEEIEVLEELGYEVIEDLSSGDGRTFLVSLNPFRAVTTQLGQLEASELVEYAEPNFVYSVGAVSNDPAFTQGDLWGMAGAGSTPANQYGSNAAAAWADGYTGNPNVYVAVLDSGVDFNHPDLSPNMWVNSSETANGLDSDANGYVDDVYGYDFVNEDDSVFDIDEHPHGTHVAGTIAARGGNGEGVAGVAWNVKLISAKMIDAEGEATLSDAIAAINYVTELRTKKGLDIIAMNASWGGDGYSEALQDAIQRGGDAGIAFIAAAGNGEDGVGRNLDSARSYPAELDCRTEARDWDCIISVAALNENGNLAGFSDYSSTTVDISAPGVDILSTYTTAGVSPARGYQYLSGTSMAAPHVTGALALCVSSYRGISAEVGIQKLLDTAAATTSVATKVATGGRLDVGALVSSCVSDTATFSGNHSDVYASAIYTDRIRLDWSDTVVGDFEQEIQIAVGPSGCTGTFRHFAFIGPGLTSYPVNDLDEAEFYCFRIRSNVQNASSFSYSVFQRSNVSITWTSNLPFIYGKVVLDDGVTPVVNAALKWVSSGQASFAASGVVVKTDSTGNYVTQVSNGTKGTLSVELPISTRNQNVMTSPPIPWGLVASGALTINQDTQLDFKVPKQHNLTFKVTDNGAPVANAVVMFGESAKYCKSTSGYLPFPGALESTCKAWPTGVSSSRLKTNAAGELTLPFLDGDYFTNPNHLIAVIDPIKLGRVKTVSVNPQADAVLNVELPATSVISGQVVLDDGVTPVAGLPVYWRAESQWDDSDNVGIYGVVTDSSGSYSLEVADGTPGHLYASTPIRSSRTPMTSPMVPWGMRAGGSLTITADRDLDLKLPEQHIVTLQVTEHDSTNPVSGAKVQYASLAEYCRGTAYVPFAGASSVRCQYWATGVSSSNFTTNSAGQISFAVWDNKYFTLTRDRKYSVQDPVLSSRVAQVLINVDQDTTIPVSMPGPVTISGVVRMADGTAVEGAPIKWVADSQYSSNGNSSAATISGPGGAYSLEVSMATPGELFVETTRNAASGPVGNPQLPWGLRAGGKLTANADTLVNFTLPEQHVATLNVREMSDFGPGEPVANATIRYDVLAQYCRSGSYSPFSGATGSSCLYWPVGFSGSGPKTNASGVVNIPLLAPKYFTNNTYLFSATHPMDPARVKTVSITAGSNQSFDLEMPGTPSQPEQPNAVAGDGSVTLTWTEPWNGGAFIDFYQVWVSRAAEGPFELVTSGDCAGEIAPDRRSCTVSGLTAGETYYFAIIAKNVVGYSQLSMSVASTPRTVNQPLALTPTPTLSGSFVVDQVVTAVTGTWDAGVTLSYKWQRDGATISGASSNSYQIQTEDIGKRLTVLVTGTKTGFDSAERTSAESSFVTAGTLSLSPTPTLSGSFVEGQTITATPGTWDSGVTLSYQWFSADQAIVSATEPTLTLTTAQVGTQIRVEVTGVKNGYSSVTKSSTASASVAQPIVIVTPVTVALPTLTIMGEPIAGQLLTAYLGDYDGDSELSFQWLRNQVAIPSATTLEYRLSAADVGSMISVKVSALGVLTASSVSASDEVGPVQALEVDSQSTALTLTPTPIISGSATSGSTLTATVGTWDEGAIMSYQWLRDSVEVFNATSLTYELTSADLGSRMSFRVTGSKNGIQSVVRISAETAVIAFLVVPTSGGGGGAAPVAIPPLSTPLPAGKSVVVLSAEGAVINADLAVSKDGKSLGLSGFGWKLELSSLTGLTADASGALTITAGAPVTIAASGYQVGSLVYFYLVPKSTLQVAAFDTSIAAMATQPTALGTALVKIDGSFSYELKTDLTGDYLLQVSGTTLLGAKTSVALSAKLTSAGLDSRTWAKRMNGNTQAKLYAKNIVGLGKVSFRVNGKEIAWAKAKNLNDKKLRIVGEDNYLVRTINLTKGKNVLEVYVDGKRTTRTVYSR